MCHVLLLLPLLLLPLLWLLPVDVALPLLAAAGIVAALAWWFAARAMSRPPVTGLESLPGRVARVTAANGTSGTARIDLELWDVVSPVPLEVGQPVHVCAVEDMVLRVEPIDRQPAEPVRREPAGS